MSYLDLNTKFNGMSFRSQLIPPYIDNVRAGLNELDYASYGQVSRVLNSHPLDVNRNGRPYGFLNGLSVGRACEKASQIDSGLNYLHEYPRVGHPLDVNGDGRVDFRDGYIIGRQLERPTSYINL